MKRFPRLLALVLALGTTSALAEKWHTAAGNIEGRLSAVYGPLVVIARSNGATIVPMDNLGDAEIARVADFLESQPTAMKWKDSTSKLARAVRDKLEILPKPYFVALDPKRYQTLERPDLKATLTINERGEVTDASFEPKQSAVIDYQLTTDAGDWRFLPAIKDGKPTAMTVVLPVHIAR